MSIGLQIAIRQTDNNDDSAVYEFFVRPGRGGLALGETTGRPGTVRLTKATGEVVLVEPCPDDRDDILLSRVVGKLKRHWKKEEYPETTWWAG
jgi:hypothetical protein